MRVRQAGVQASTCPDGRGCAGRGCAGMSQFGDSERAPARPGLPQPEWGNADEHDAGAATARREVFRCDVLLLGYESQENLGLRSIAAYLGQNGVRASIQPLQAASPEEIRARIASDRPRLVGFSLIFQRMLPQFEALIARLRDQGVSAHFTMGGHFPTFEYRFLLEQIPGLDTVVRHEGELTVLELFRRLDEPDSWHTIRGLAYRRNGAVQATSLRPLIADLDELPYPVRNAVPATHRGIGVSSLIGSRGCYYDCTFCSIQEFYREPPGPKRRSRSPANVAGEMEQLHRDQGVRIFIFQDDDLFMKGRTHRAWIDGFIAEIDARGLTGRILWRVSCRVDDLDAAILAPMKAAGLASVYIGIESGSAQGLRTFNKHYTVDDVHRAVGLLEGVDLPFEFGFMILDPDSTFGSVRENVEFLGAITSGGRSLVNFCKMAPYAGTPIARRLADEGRLTGTPESPDYTYDDPRLDFLQLFLSRTFNFRNFSDEGMVERLRFAKFDVTVVSKFFARELDGRAYDAAVRSLIERCNDSALETLGLASGLMARLPLEGILDNWGLLERYRQDELLAQLRLTEELDDVQARFGLGSTDREPRVAVGEGMAEFGLAG